jgi:glycosyltransferase involved in cell wall biosynthesis
MEILLDAREATANTGTGNVIRNLYPNIIKTDKINSYTILYSKTDPFPNLKCKKIKSPKDKGARFTYIWQIFGLSHFLNKNKFNVFFSVENFVYPIYFKGTTIISIQDLIPIAIDNYYDKYKDKIKYKIQLLSLKFMKKNDLIFTVSNFSKNEIIKYLKINKNKIFVIYNGINIKKAPILSTRYLMKNNIKKPYILAIGGAEKRKNNKILVKAFNELKIKEKLVIIGKINREESASQFDTLNIKNNKNIITPGIVDQKTLSALYKNASVFVFLSYYEGFGLPPLEALSFSIPTLCTDKTSLPEIYKDTVLYTDPFNKNEIKEKLIEIISNQTMREKLIKNSKQLIKELTWQKSAENFIQTLNTIQK